MEKRQDEATGEERREKWKWEEMREGKRKEMETRGGGRREKGGDEKREDEK